jgi:hypothetical protein
MLNWAKWIEVESSNIEKFRYSKENKTLFVVFKKSSDIYCYGGVPASVFNKLLESNSVGEFINTKVKPKYNVDKLESKATKSKKSVTG